MVCPVCPIAAHVALRGNVDSLDAPRASLLFTFRPRGAGYCTERVVNGLKKQQKIGEANGMPSLPIVPTHVALRGNVDSLDAPRASLLFTFGPRGAGYCTERVVNGLKKSAKNRGSQWYAQSAHCAHTCRVKGKYRFSGRS